MHTKGVWCIRVKNPPSVICDNVLILRREAPTHGSPWNKLPCVYARLLAFSLHVKRAPAIQERTWYRSKFTSNVNSAFVFHLINRAPIPPREADFTPIGHSWHISIWYLFHPICFVTMRVWQELVEERLPTAGCTSWVTSAKGLGIK